MSSSDGRTGPQAPSTGRRPPVLRGDPGLGCVRALAQDPVGLFVDAATEHGPVFDVALPTGSFTVVAGQAAHGVDEAELSRGGLFGAFGDEIGAAIFSAEGAEHRALRKALALAMSRGAAAESAAEMARVTAHWASRRVTGDRLKLLDELTRVCVLATMRALTAVDLAPGLADFERFADRVMQVTMKTRPRWVLRGRRYRRARDRARARMDAAIAQHRAGRFGELGRVTILDLLLDAQRAAPDLIDDTAVRGAALYVLLGARWYVGALTSWMVYEALRNPALGDAVREEVDDVFSRGAPSALALRRLPHLRALYLETLRTHPIVPGLPFRARRDITVGGRRVARGTSVLLCPVTGHFDPAQHPDPMRFDAARMRAPRSEHQPPEGFAPFGTAERLCLARGMVEVIATTVVATTLRTLRLRLPRPTYTARPRVAPVIVPADGLPTTVVGQRPPGARPTAPVAQVGPEILGRLAREELPGTLVREWRRNTVIIQQGAPSDAMYLVLTGSVAVERDGERLAELGPGAVFGEMGLLKGAPRSARVVALQKTRGMELPRRTALELMAQHDLVGGEIGELMEQRYHHCVLAAAFPGLGTRQPTTARDGMSQLSARDGEAIVREGEPPDALYVILSGGAQVMRDGPDGPTSLAELGAGAYFGEVGLLSGRPRNATVRARGQTELLRISGRVFGDLARVGPVRREVVRTMLDRLDDMASRGGQRP